MISYKSSTIKEIEKQMLANISDDYIKEPGTFTNDLIKTFAIQSNEIENKIEELFKKLDANNFYGDELDRFVFQRKGIKRKNAISAIGTLIIKGNGKIKKGDLFETVFGTQFQAIEDKIINESTEIKIKAVIPGTSGNVGANTILFIPITIQGITEVINNSPTQDGYDQETDKSLKERYFIEIQKPATSGNIYHYMQWSREIIGVGNSKIFPLWNGNNTVQIVIIDDLKLPGNNELINRVQEYIDPKGSNNETWGTGAGQAPIGAYCTVISAVAKVINIQSTLVLKKGYTLEKIKPFIEQEIKDYLKTIAFIRNSVSYALLSSWILNVEGIQEWTNFTLNGLQENIIIGNKEVAIMGSVNLNVT